MSFYQKAGEFGEKFFKKSTLFKSGFNLSPMYRRTTARIIFASDDLMDIHIRLPISYRNRNYVNSIFGGSMFAAVDPFPMVQLMNIIGNDYVVWDKAAEIKFRRPARQDLYAEFTYSPEEVEEIRNQVAEKQEIEITKTTKLTDRNKQKVFCEVNKTIYIANKAYFKQKRSQTR